MIEKHRRQNLPSVFFFVVKSKMRFFEELPLGFNGVVDSNYSLSLYFKIWISA